MKIGMEIDERGDKHILLIPENDMNILEIGQIVTQIDSFDVEYTNDTEFPEPAKIKSIKIGENAFIGFLLKRI